MTTILVVEDNVPLGCLFQKFLTGLGAAVEQTTTCEQTVAYLETSKTPDAILLDMSLPDGDGITVINYLKTKPGLAKIPIIMMSGHDHYARRAGALGVEHFFHKPVSVTMLAECMKKVLFKPEPPTMIGLVQ